MDAFTLNLLTNDEVLAVDQDPLGKEAVLKSDVTVNGDELRVYVKQMEDGSEAVGLFNLGSTAATVTAYWYNLGISGPEDVRDSWRQVDKGTFNGQYSMTVAPHGAELLRISTPVPEPSATTLLVTAFVVLLGSALTRLRTGDQGRRK